MRNKNKTALTAEEIFNEIYEENKETLKFFDKRTLALGFVKGFNAASLQTKEKDKEIEELKTSIEGVFGWREKNHHLTISEKQLKSQLSEVTKERDELREGMQKIATYRSESISSQIARNLLTPTKE